MRHLYVYVNKDPARRLDQDVKDFLALALSEEGQEVVKKDGFFALPRDAVAAELRKLE